jgi:hypothetical protein
MGIYEVLRATVLKDELVHVIQNAEFRMQTLRDSWDFV